jgi:hypothetical protein
VLRLGERVWLCERGASDSSSSLADRLSDENEVGPETASADLDNSKVGLFLMNEGRGKFSGSGDCSNAPPAYRVNSLLGDRGLVLGCTADWVFTVGVGF